MKEKSRQTATDSTPLPLKRWSRRLVSASSSGRRTPPRKSIRSGI